MYQVVQFFLYHLVHHTAKEKDMKTQDVVLLFGLGLAIWIAGTFYYAAHGVAILETTAARYWTSFLLSPILSAAICIAILKWRHIAPSSWAQAMLLLAIPGMIGEAVVLSHLAAFMPRLQAASGGKYGAFLFATYAVALGIAEIVALKAA
jgi:hypothetical protein